MARALQEGHLLRRALLDYSGSERADLLAWADRIKPPELGDVPPNLLRLCRPSQTTVWTILHSRRSLRRSNSHGFPASPTSYPLHGGAVHGGLLI